MCRPPWSIPVRPALRCCVRAAWKANEILPPSFNQKDSVDPQNLKVPANFLKAYAGLHRYSSFVPSAWLVSRRVIGACTLQLFCVSLVLRCFIVAVAQSAASSTVKLCNMNLWFVIGLILYSLAFLIPSVKLLQRAGYPLYFAIFSVIPVLNIVALWMYAFSSWPNRVRVF